MKKSFYLLPLVLLILAVVSCKPKDIEDEIPDSTITPPKEVLDEETQINRLQTVARNLINFVDEEKHRHIVELADGLWYKYSEYDWEPFYDTFVDEYESVFRMPKHISSTISCEERIVARNPLYRFSFKNDARVFEANDATKTWEYKGKSPDGVFTVIFTSKEGTRCVAKAWGEGKETEYSYTYEHEYGHAYYDNEGYYHYVVDSVVNKTYTGLLPETIRFTLTEDNTVLINFTEKLDIQKNNHLHTNTNCRCANIEFNMVEKLNSTAASFAFNLKLDNRAIVTMNAAVPSFVLIEKKDNDTWEQWLERYEDEYEILLQQVGGCNAFMDLNGDVQVRVALDNFGKAYQELDAWDKKEYGDERREMLDMVDIVNKHMETGLYYGNDIKQAELKLDVVKREGYYETYYDWTPAIYFPKSGTTYLVDDFYNQHITEGTYSGILQMTEDLINHYISMFRYLRIDPIHF